MEKACGHKLATKLGSRRAGLCTSGCSFWSLYTQFMCSNYDSGDIATCYANVEAANRDLKWNTTKTLSEMCEGILNYCTYSGERMKSMLTDLWRWQHMNPNGF